MKKSTYLLTLLLTALFCLPWNEVKAVQSLPYSYGFETDLLVLEDGWTTQNPSDLNSSEFGIAGAAKNTGYYGFRFSSYYDSGTNTQYLISPELDGTTGVDVSFYYMNSSKNNTEKFKVGYSSTTADISSFTWGSEISKSNASWQEYTNSFPAGTKYIAIYYYSSYKYRLYVDDFNFTAGNDAPITCPAPSALTKSAVSATSATFTWTKGDAEEEWQYICLPAATAVDWNDANVKTATSATAIVNNLTAGTEYKFYVRAYCNADDQSKEVVKAFKTPCADYATADLPFEENFTGKTSGTFPDCWSKIAFVSGTTSYPVIYGNNGESGSNSMRFYGGVTGTSEQIAIFPPFEAETNTLLLSFWYKNSSASYGQGIIGYMTDPEDASTFHQLSVLAKNTSGVEVSKFAMTGATPSSYIAIKFTGGSYSSNLYLDNIKVSLPSSCTDPTGVSAVVASATSANLSWTENGSATTWNLQYSTDNFSTSTTVSGITENPYTLNGLTPSTTYKVRIQSDCGGEQSDWVVSNTFSTPCEDQTGVGYEMNFDNVPYGSGSLPSCWQKNSSSNYPYVSNNYAKSGYCLYFFGGITGSSEQIAILPPFSEKTSMLSIALEYNNATNWDDYSGANYGQLSIGYITDPADASTFVAKETLSKVKSYTAAEVAMTGAPDDAYIALRYAGGVSSGLLAIDNIVISQVSSCLKPSSVSGSATASNSASISWTENGSATAWQIRYSSDNGDNWSDAIDANTNPFILTGLSGNTDYLVQVQSMCDEVSGWTAAVSFSTPCDPIDASDYNENFENSAAGIGKLPDCWQYKEKYSTGYPYVYEYDYYAYAGSKCLYFYGGVDESSEQSVLLPEMDQPLNDLTLEFYYKAAESGWYTYAKFTVGYIAADGITFVPVETLNYADNYTKYSKVLSEVPSDAKCLAIRFAGGEYSAYGYIDNVRVYPTPTCAAPTGVTVSDVTATTAQVAWTENNSATAWKLQYSTDGTNWTDVNGGAVVTNPYTLTGLTPNQTAYYVRVKAVCGSEDESQWSDVSDVFYTECEARSLPFNEDFNADLACWTQTNCVSGTGLTDNKFMFKYTYNPSQYLITPAIDTENKPVTVEFDYYVSNSSYPETFMVGYSTTTNEISAFTWGEAVTATNTSTNVLRYSDVLPVGVKYVAIQHASYDKYFLYIDNFAVEEMPACPNVKANSLTANSITANSATVSWSVAYNETAWNLQYKAEDGEWSEAIAVVTTPSFSLTGLDASTVYYVRVQANCGEDGTSQYTDGAFFFQTDCEAMTVDYGNEWNYGFEAEEGAAVNTVPACWNQICSIEDPSYAYALVDNAGAKTGSQFMHMEVYHNYNAIIVLPAFTNDLSELQISFAYRNDQTSTSYGQLEIGYYLNETFTRIGDKLARVDSYTDMTVKMPEDAPEGAKMAFRVVGSGGYRRTHAYIDDVVVGKKAIDLAQADDNGAVLAALEGQVTDVVLDRTFYVDGGFNTICLPFGLPTLDGTPLEGGELLAFKYGYVENGELLLRVYPTEAIEAGVPYLISWAEGSDIVSPLFKSVTIAASEGKAVGENNDVKFVGIFAPDTFQLDDKTKLFMLANNQIAWSGYDGHSLKSFRAYFQTNTPVGTEPSNAPIRHGMPARIVMGEQIATGCENIQGGQVQSLKVLENNQVVIIRNGVKYNLQGQKIQ